MSETGAYMYERSLACGDIESTAGAAQQTRVGERKNGMKTPLHTQHFHQCLLLLLLLSPFVHFYPLLGCRSFVMVRIFYFFSLKEPANTWKKRLDLLSVSFRALSKK